MSTISISDDSSEDSSSAQGTSESNSVQGLNEGTSEPTVKPRNIAVKKGTPVTPQSPHHPSNKKGFLKWDKDLLKGSRFLEDFNPENSKREKNKRYNISKPKPQKKKSSSMYDEQGRIRMTKEDICDCFDDTCPGCHFPCMTCQSAKCGIRCRVNRKWAYDMVELDGRTMPMSNPLLTTVRNN